jgi:hypothetical protein
MKEKLYGRRRVANNSKGKENRVSTNSKEELPKSSDVGSYTPPPQCPEPSAAMHCPASSPLIALLPIGFKRVGEGRGSRECLWVIRVSRTSSIDNYQILLPPLTYTAWHLSPS